MDGTAGKFGREVESGTEGGYGHGRGRRGGEEEESWPAEEDRDYDDDDDARDCKTVTRYPALRGCGCGRCRCWLARGIEYVRSSGRAGGRAGG